MNTEVQSMRAKQPMPAFVWGSTAGTIVATDRNAALFAATSSFAFPPDAITMKTGAPVGLADSSSQPWLVGQLDCASACHVLWSHADT